MDRTVTVRSVGPNKMKMPLKASNGRTEEWTLTASPKGIVRTGVDHTSGESVTIVMERFTNIFGDFKVIGTIGMEEGLKAMGISFSKKQSN